MTIIIGNPRLVHALKSQAQGLGIPTDTLAESALATHMGFAQIAQSVTGAALQPELALDYPAMAVIPR